MLTKIQHKTQDYASNLLDEALKKPGCTAKHPEKLKFSLKKISSNRQNPLYISFYTPEQLGITDLNNDSTSVPWFRKTVVDSETG